MILSAAYAAIVVERLAHAEVRIGEGVALAHATGAEFALVSCTGSDRVGERAAGG